MTKTLFHNLPPLKARDLPISILNVSTVSHFDVLFNPLALKSMPFFKKKMYVYTHTDLFSTVSGFNLLLILLSERIHK